MTDGDALIHAILAAPDDDTPRLVYADWLDDAGHADRAALIRVQVGLAREPDARLKAEEALLLGSTSGDRVRQLRRGWALPRAVRRAWPRGVGGWEWHRGFPEVWHCPLAFWEAHGPAIAAAGPLRRVVPTDREPAAPAVNPRKPERTWFRDDAGWVEPPADACLLPPAVFDLLDADALDLAMFDHARTYATRGAAIDAVSSACLLLSTMAVRAGV
ncbi:MAG TPA: TIGR02996 domain-containing protein [Urbifossiella sp.]|nr:TIGR02996 domain-containing protein [Urbifossiella sp.]